MKLFGKKTLALLLALSMMMSVCVFADNTQPLTITGDSSVKVKGTLNLSTDAPAGATVSWRSSDPNVASVADGVVTGVAAGTATITALAEVTTTTGEGESAVTTTVNYEGSKTVTVSADTSQPVTQIAVGDSSVIVPYGIASPISYLDDIQLTVTHGEYGSVTTKTSNWTIESGTFDATNMSGSWIYKPTVGTLAEGAQVAGVTVTVGKASIAAGESTNVGTVTVLVGTSVSDVKDLLPEYVALALNNGQTKAFSIGSYSSNSSVNGCYGAWTTSNYNDDYTGTYTFTATPATNTYYSMSTLTVTVKAVDSDFTVSAERNGTSLSSVAGDINDLVNGMFGESAEVIEIDDMEMEGGDLYIIDEDGYAIEADTDMYDLDDFADLVYYPNGNGEDSYIEYYAYPDEDDDDTYVHGTITFKSSSFMLVTAEMTTDDVLMLDAEVFEEAFLNMDSDYDSLEFITIPSPGNSKSKGYFYFDYDTDDEKGEKVTSSTKLYYDEDYVDDDDDTYIDNVVYIPGSSMKAGTYEFQFKATGEDEDGDEVKNKIGYLRITLIEKADITVEAGLGERVEIDPDWFVEILEDEKDTDEIAYVVISGAPRSEKAGYLFTDGDELTKSGDKSFYADEDDVDVDKKKYDLYDLYFVGGEKATTTNATFKIYYLKSNGKVNSSPVTGTIDFVVGTSRSLNGSLRASEVMSFNDKTTLSNFEDLGGNDNVYVEFTSLPVGGKLYYNYGTSSQEDVTIGTDYYIGTASGKKQLKNITFVPSYSSSKVDRTISMNIKAYNSKDKAVTGTINIAVDYATNSLYFNDVSTSTYADSVDFLKNQGITTGMTTTSFGLTSNVTRGQFVTFLYRAAGQPAVYGVNNFKDVKTGDYYYNAVRWAVQEGITTGRSATVFDPNANVTHQELLTFLYRYDVTYLGHSGTTGSASYVYDYSKVDTWAQTAVKWAVYKGVIESGYLYPTTAGTRGTVALYLHRMLTL